MGVVRNILKVIMWVLIIGFGCNFIMQKISYSFYKNVKNKTEIMYKPVKLKMSDTLTGYGYNLDEDSSEIILFFGGSNYTAYNSVCSYAGQFDCPFIAADYYGTQESKGKMNIKTMQKTAEDMYHWAVKKYPDSRIIVMGHSYGTGMASYLASRQKCDKLFLLAGYRDLSDLYNKMTPIFWGPLKVFISNDIRVSDYGKDVACPVYVVGSDGDKTLNAKLQKKLANCFKKSKLKIFKGITHEEYLVTDEVISYIKDSIQS